MFNSIRGTITEKLAEGVRILTGGLEWDIAVPAIDMEELPPAGEPGRIFTWLYHRDDQMKLFGFADERRRATFLELLKVEGIGPKGALRIMGGITQEQMEQALDTGDLARLEAVPGLGKKTAQKMILALKGKLARESVPQPQGPQGELVDALVEMGYDRRASAEAVAKAAEALDPALTGTEKEKFLFREAIVYLSGQ
jgi:Holliday junction DNA helicase RuvA